ncbi:MAG: response regulator transcription factor [Anaerolineales bacterium]|nr:response regulator transcription factor [Anaerolineales bacterium]
MNRIRVLLADDHTLVRKGLRSLLDAEAGLEVVGEAEDGREAVHKAQALAPDVVLMDITMPGLNGLEATRQIRKALPRVKVLALTVHANAEYVFQILRAGASGYLVKQAAVTELIEAIRTVSRGETYLSAALSPAAVEAYRRQAEAMAAPPRLTDREREVLQLIAEGRTNREIAGRLAVSVKTVEAHRAHVMEKLGLRTTAELTKYALRQGIITSD